MFAELVGTIKNTSQAQILQLGHFVDVFDNYNSWRCARIIAIRDDLMTVTFDGWSQKYDESHKFNSSRVAYFRSHTEPYTGAQKQAQRDFNFQNEVDHIQQTIQRMQQLIISEFRDIKAPELCQFVRGELYYLVDNILQETQIYQSGELKISTDLLEAFIRFYVVWSELCLKHIQTYIAGIAQHTQMFYFHTETGIVACFPEMFDTMCKLFQAGQPRTKRYFQNNEQALWKLYQVADKYQPSHLGFYKYFQQEKGIESIEKLLLWAQHDENQTIVARIPFPIIRQLLPLIEGVQRSMASNSKVEWLQKIKEMVFQRLQSLTALDMKENPTVIFTVLKNMPQHFISIQTIAQECECAEVKLALSLIKSNILDKKIKGIKELSDMIDKTQKSYQYHQGISTYFNDQRLAKYFVEEKVFDTLLSEAQHPEVFKRAAPVLRFIAEMINMKQSDIEALWLAAQSRHEAEAKSVYEVISDLAKVLQWDQIDKIQQMVVQIQHQNYDQCLVKFLMDFTINQQRNSNKGRPKNLPSLNLMWELLQDKALTPNHLYQQLLSGFHYAVRQEKEFYWQFCMDNIKRGTSFPQSLHILQKIIESYGPGGWNSNSSEDMLSKAMKEAQLTDLIIKNLETYRLSVQDCQDCQLILQGKLPHIIRIQYYMDFLEYLAASPKKVEFSLEHIKKLWDILVVRPIHESDRTPMLDFLVKGGFRVREDLFTSLFCNFNYDVKACYKSLEQYFFIVNQKAQTINRQKSQIRVIKYEQIQGLNFFFDVVFKRNDCEAAISTLVALHLRTEKMNAVDQKINMWQAFLKRCKEGLSKPENQISNIIKCIKEFVTGIEGKQQIGGNTPSSVKFFVQLGKDDKTLKELSLPSNMTLLASRKIINQAFGLKDQDYDFHLVNFDVKLHQESEEDHGIQILEESKMREKPDIMIVNISQNPHPLAASVNKFKALLSANTEISEILFELLENYEDIWEVLTIMPTNRQIRSSLEKGANTEEQWGNILHFNCNKKLLYCLQIFEKMLDDRGVLLNFIKNKGFLSLQNYYIKRQEQEFANPFNLKCFAQIAKTLNIVLSDREFGYKANIDHQLQSSVLKFIIFSLTKLENKVYTDSSSIQSFLQYNFKLVPMESCQEYKKVIQIGLLDWVDSQIRKVVATQMIALSKSLQNFFFDILKQQDLSIAVRLKNQGEQFIEFFVGVLQSNNSSKELVDIAQNLSEIVLQLIDLDDTDKILAQCFKLLEVIVKQCQVSKTLIQSNTALAEALINKCLFQLPSDKQPGAKCQSIEARKSGYEIVQQLFANQELMQILDVYFNYAYWRTASTSNWNIAAQMQNKSRTGYVGLKNIGCICYMNSLMQQLFTLPNFRDSILQLSLEQKQQSVLYQVQLLLSALKHSQKQYYDPRPLCNVLGPEQTPINVTEQMDADEFYLGLMDKLENELKPLNRDMVIRKNFGWYLATEFISRECAHKSSRSDYYLTLSLQVKGKRDITESLKTMVEGEVLEGNNAYLCEKCEKKVTALMRVSVKQLPNVLLIALKRFEFNFETLQKYKLNDYYEFSTSLNMKPYTQEYLRQQDSKEQEDGETPIEIQEYAEEYYEYQLRGVIIHVGTADNGHYYSLIKDQQTGAWFEFNDQFVKPFDFAELANEAFGDKSGKSTNIMNRSKNAYMLFYERQVYFDENGKALRTENDLRWYFQNNSALKSQGKQIDEILFDNIKFQISQIMFDEAFYEFAYNLMRSANIYEISKFCLQYFLAVVIRFSERSGPLPKYLTELKKIVRANSRLSDEFLRALQRKEFLEEMILHNPIIDMRVIVAGLVQDAVKCISQNERNQSYQDFKAKSSIAALTRTVLQHLWESRNCGRNTDQMYRILYLISQTENGRRYLKELKTFGRILLFFLDEPPVGAGYCEIVEHAPQSTFMATDKNFIQNELVGQPVQSLNRWDCTQFDYTYLICTLKEIIDQLDDDEVALMEDPMLIKRLLQVSYSRMARNALKEVFRLYIVTHCNADAWTASLALVQSIYEFMKDCDEREIKTCLVALRGIAEIEDIYSEQRCVLISEAYLLSLKDNLSYWYYASQVIDYILKLGANTQFRAAIVQVLQQNRSVSKLLQNWLKESQNPYQNFNQQRWKACRRRQASVMSLDLQDKLPRFQQLANKRQELFQKIVNNQNYESGYDSEQEPQELQPGKQIDVIIPIRTYANHYDNSNYGTWEILQNMGDMLEIRTVEIKENKPSPYSTRWINVTDSSIAGPNTLRIKYENHINFIKY